MNTTQTTISQITKPHCGDFGGKRTDGQPCRRAAGWGTDHVGTGKCRRCCRFGAGRPATRPETILKNAMKTQTQLAQRAEQLKDSGLDVFDQTDLLFRLRALLESLEGQIQHPDTHALDPSTIGLYLATVDATRKLYETVERVKNMGAYGASEQQTVVNVLSLVFTDSVSLYEQSSNAQEFTENVKQKIMGHIQTLRGFSGISGSHDTQTPSVPDSFH